MNSVIILILVSGIIAFLVTPIIKKLAIKFNVMDVPKSNRKVHKKPIPLLGGLAIYIPFVLLTLTKKSALTDAEIGIVLGATIIIIGGILDDKWDLTPYEKLFFQLMAAVVLLIMGVNIQLIANPFTNDISYLDIGYLSIPITIVWVVGITNAMNLIDGLDGLSAGVSLISTITIFLIALTKDRSSAMYLTAILMGAITGFLPYNFNPASIFLGDTGSQLLGFLLAAISMEGAIKSATIFSVVVPILTMGLPIFDTIFAIIRRKINGRPIMEPDRGHLHHRLLNLGLSQRRVVLIMYLISALLSGLAIFSVQLSSLASYYLLISVIILIGVICWRIGLFKHED
ncbi:MAG: undecaprenyl/decaprenyl-phosphate alpha-N-acetylglucosaminyl 1-phosphate transferase [Clostridiales bacterium]|mgnify:CR=1 FL=1|uniref:MraY family glycosyltransferase n=1 Tax=Clostridium sp. N3C TaxID=1776758 RepID=UPI00092DF670|nr:MraY family glycosyltransferase [Clostridium sp. N3C]NLZ47269.1 undecaprenyl/decaprenyl-phosphate alpha-N-acetylglucosaminyl 1-phosphate transferase [Clostridiales bacterium]SCN23889.1 putative undecaprenyl-phosphate N-acetylglucosaminyl 1-phosphate transferase [Clostridium sp. N3C]